MYDCGCGGAGTLIIGAGCGGATVRRVGWWVYWVGGRDADCGDAIAGRPGCCTYWIEGRGVGCARCCGLGEKLVEVLLELY